jgi:hypothetical protein
VFAADPAHLGAGCSQAPYSASFSMHHHDSTQHLAIDAGQAGKSNTSRSSMSSRTIMITRQLSPASQILHRVRHVECGSNASTYTSSLLCRDNLRAPARLAVSGGSAILRTCPLGRLFDRGNRSTESDAQAYISAQPPSPFEDPRLSHADEDQERGRGALAPSRQGTPSRLRLCRLSRLAAAVASRLHADAPPVSSLQIQAHRRGSHSV